ncbi:MAG TPA: BrnA antitoxin family protein [Arenibaculum sp.]|nr:BrnA antitoxin family protein [Arenibaculum sp.]
MTENKRDLGSDLAKVDAHVIHPEEYEEIPELGDEWFARAEPHQGGEPVKRGRPRSEMPKRHINIRLSGRVVDHFKATGPGWQGRIDAALLDWIDSRK